MTALIRADILKLVKRRGLMIAGAALTLGLPLVALLVQAIGRAVNPETFEPFGGGGGYETLLDVAGFGLFVTVLMLGAVAGSIDESRGVFRDLVATGVDRVRLGLARVPAVVVVAAVAALAATVLAVVVGYAAAGPDPMPSGGQLVRDVVVMFANVVFVACLAVGVGALSGSVSITLTTLFSWFLIIEPILVSVGFLGDARRFFTGPALAALARPERRFEGEELFGLTAVGGLGVLALWVGVTLGLGIWRVATRDA